MPSTTRHASDINTSFSTTIVSTTQASNETALSGSSFENYHCGLISLAIVILICNLFAIQAYKRHEKIRRNSSNVMLLSLAISDLIIAVLYLPIIIYCESQWDKYIGNEAYVSICRCAHLVGTFSGFSTIFHIIALTVDKYLAVLHPFQKLSLSSRGTYRKILVTVWLLALAFALVPLFWIFDDALSPSWLKKLNIYGIAQATVFLGLASVILLYCYVRMFVQIHVRLSACTQTGRVQTKTRNDRKTVLIFLMFFTIFVVGWSPWFFFTLNLKHETLVSLEVKDFLVSLRYAGAVLNPLIYTFIKTDYKQAVEADFRACFSSCPRPISFQKLLQTNTNGTSNNNTRRGTLTTGSGDTVKLQQIEGTGERGACGSFTSGATADQFSSQADDTHF